MSLLWTAFLLGLAGSGHCAGMCGPIALALPVAAGNRLRFLLGRAAYNSGRITTYALFGAVAGALGQGLALAGWQRGLTIAAGSLILAGLFFSHRWTAPALTWRFVSRSKEMLGAFLKRPSAGSQFLLGILNGFLPCGLVYTAAGAATAAGGILDSMLYLVVFGLGTFPMMLALSLGGYRLQPAFRFRLQKLIPVSVGLVGVLLIMRGLALGIPYLSPALGGAAPACH